MEIFLFEQLLKPSTLLDIVLDLHFSFATLFLPLELSKLNKRNILHPLSNERRML